MVEKLHPHVQQELHVQEGRHIGLRCSDLAERMVQHLFPVSLRNGKVGTKKLTYFIFIAM